MTSRPSLGVLAGALISCASANGTAPHDMSAAAHEAAAAAKTTDRNTAISSDARPASASILPSSVQGRLTVAEHATRSLRPPCHWFADEERELDRRMG